MNQTAPRRVAITEFLPLSNVHLDISGADRQAVLAELVNGMSELADRAEARQTLLHALEEREALCSTGVGDGVALPHARNALVGLVEQPVLVFGRHLRGVDFGAIDARPAMLFFLLVAPNVTQHLQILARLSRLLRQPTLRRRLLKAQHPAQVLAALQSAEAALPE